MITEKQKEAVQELCRYVDEFCKENDLSVFMNVAASENHPDGLEQVAGSITIGKGDHIVGAISGVAKANKNIYMLLSMGLMQAYTGKADINVIPTGGRFEYELINADPEMKNRIKVRKERQRKCRTCRPDASAGKGSYGPGVYMDGVLITSVYIHEHE